MALTAKLTPIGAGLASSPDSSSDSSTGSPPRPCPDVQRVESEGTLPGVIISQHYHYTEFFLKLYQLGCDLEHGKLRESARVLLHLLPCDRQTVKMLQTMCRMPAQQIAKLDELAADQLKINKQTNVSSLNAANTTTTTSTTITTNTTTTTTTPSMPALNPQDCTPEMLFLHPSPAQVLYNLGVFSGLLIPALEPYGEAALQIQSSWLHSGCAHFILELLTKNNFLPNADMNTKRAAFQCVLRLAKLFLYIVACVLARVGDESMLVQYDGTSRSQVDILKQLLTSIPNNSESTLRIISTKLGESLAVEMLSATAEGERCRKLFHSTLQWLCPDISTIKAVVQLAWASACGSLHLLGTTNDYGEDVTQPDAHDFAMCKEALEVLTVSLVLNPSANEALSTDPVWSKFITSLILKNPLRHVRQVAAEQLFLTCTYCAGDRRAYAYMVNLLVSSLKTLVPQHEATCADFFQLLCRTLSYGCALNWSLNIAEGLLAEEIIWLQQIRENVKRTGDIQVHEDLLEGHLCLTKELMILLSPESKAQLNDLIQNLIDDFLFTASREYLHLRKTGKLKNETAPPPVCRSPHTIAAACDLLIALCQHCVPNMKLLTNTIIDFVCTDTDPLREWDYLPPVGGRPAKGFCGLKNAGATCYMNSVLQQLYMVPSIRVGLLRAEGAAVNETEDFSSEPDAIAVYNSIMNTNAGDDGGKCPSRNYHVIILKHVQAIFAHLGHSALQFYVPRGLWMHFKLQGEPVNLREQQDAVEFFMSLFESLDEGLKALGHTQLMNATLGGSFSDQKICQECPHRYSKEEPFSVFSVDIRNHSSLTESLEQYVKGELLEGADAYHCDKCDKKVVTIKRLCVRKLPPVLAIQLKRFEYDYERVCAIKFNDYFEFPRVLDMEPYTVSGLAKLEGEVIEVGDNCQSNGETTKYELTGIVVHSGQASGGHYFSYILSKNPSTGKEQWYKFDDGEVTECKMHEDDEMKAQCFGGDYMGEIYDNTLKRMQYRRQKRWWNAYMLFYTRCDHKAIQFEQSIEQLSLAESKNFVLPLPKPIERSVRNQNIRFLHSRSIFSVEFFNFIKKLVTCIVPTTRPDKMTPATEELSLLGVQLVSQFLFHTGFRTKKSLRGPVIEWYDTLSVHIRASAIVRRWFALNALLSPPTRLGEYILSAPSPEVRTVFVKLVVFFCHFALSDDPLPGYEGNNLCEQVLISVLKLLKCEAADHGKHLPHYFSLFSMFVGLGIQEKQQLLRLNVPVIFMQVALDEGPGPSIKYQYPELTKLHQVVSHLIRCSDISDKCCSSTPNVHPLPNPYRDPSTSYDELLPITPECADILFNRTGYIKKLIEDTNVGEEGLKLLQYCSWENPHFSRAVLTELLWQCGFAYCHDMRHHTEILLNILLIEDSWQNHRIHNALNGVAEEREGLLETIQRTKTHYQKRAYQILKCLTHLFHKSPVAKQMLYSNANIGRHWNVAVEWLQDELERQRGIGCQYNSYSWSPPAQSNDNTNGYMLERSQSAKNIWAMAYELCPEEVSEQEETAESDNEEAQRKQQQSTGDASENAKIGTTTASATVSSTSSVSVSSNSSSTTTTASITTSAASPAHKIAQGPDIPRGINPLWEEFSSNSHKAVSTLTTTTTTSAGANTATTTINSALPAISSSSTGGTSTVLSSSSAAADLTNGLSSNFSYLTLSPKKCVSGDTDEVMKSAVSSTEGTTTTTMSILNDNHTNATITTTTLCKDNLKSTIDLASGANEETKIRPIAVLAPFEIKTTLPTPTPTTTTQAPTTLPAMPSSSSSTTSQQQQHTNASQTVTALRAKRKMDKLNATIKTKQDAAANVNKMAAADNNTTTDTTDNKSTASNDDDTKVDTTVEDNSE